MKKTVVRISTILLLMILVLVIENAVYPATKGGWIPAMRQNVFASFTIPSKPLIDEQQPKQVETATFAMGWFWGPDSRFGSLTGVVRTRVGYAGGTKQNPTYHDLGDHTETIQIDYDPTKITYPELLDAFWTGHDTTHRSWSRQYASIIFAHNEEQRRLAEASKTRLSMDRGSTVYTEIVPYNGFTLAENYHQKHNLQLFPAFREELMRIYPSPADFVASTAVARVNGYVGGEGSYEALLKDIDSLGLSSARKEELLRVVQRYKGGQACPLKDKRTISNVRQQGF